MSTGSLSDLTCLEESFSDYRHPLQESYLKTVKIQILKGVIREHLGLRKLPAHYGAKSASAAAKKIVSLAISADWDFVLAPQQTLPIRYPEYTPNTGHMRVDKYLRERFLEGQLRPPCELDSMSFEEEEPTERVPLDEHSSSDRSRHEIDLHASASHQNYDVRNPDQTTPYGLVQAFDEPSELTRSPTPNCSKDTAQVLIQSPLIPALFAETLSNNEDRPQIDSHAFPSPPDNRCDDVLDDLNWHSELNMSTHGYGLVLASDEPSKSFQLPLPNRSPHTVPDVMQEPMDGRNPHNQAVPHDHHLLWASGEPSGIHPPATRQSIVTIMPSPAEVYNNPSASDESSLPLRPSTRIVLESPSHNLSAVASGKSNTSPPVFGYSSDEQDDLQLKIDTIPHSPSFHARGQVERQRAAAAAPVLTLFAEEGTRKLMVNEDRRWPASRPHPNEIRTQLRTRIAELQPTTFPSRSAQQKTEPLLLPADESRRLLQLSALDHFTRARYSPPNQVSNDPLASDDYSLPLRSSPPIFLEHSSHSLTAVASGGSSTSLPPIPAHYSGEQGEHWSKIHTTLHPASVPARNPSRRTPPPSKTPAAGQIGPLDVVSQQQYVLVVIKMVGTDSRSKFEEGTIIPVNNVYLSTHYYVETDELVRGLENSSYGIKRGSRLFVSKSHGPRQILTSFCLLPWDTEFRGVVDVPHLRVLSAADTDFSYYLEIYIEEPEPKAMDEVYPVHNPKARKPGPDVQTVGYLLEGLSHPRSSPPPDPPCAETSKNRRLTSRVSARTIAQVKWLRTQTIYSNLISDHLRSVGKKGTHTWALAIFCAFIYTIASETPGEDCEEAGRAAITNESLGQLYGLGSAWIAQAKQAGALQRYASEIPEVAVHMRGELMEAKMGIGTWISFLKQALTENGMEVDLNESSGEEE